MDLLTIVLVAVALVFALLAFIAYRTNSRNAEALVKMSADKSTAESELQIVRDKLEETEKNQIDVHEFQVENVKLQENLSNVEERHMQVTGDLNSARERRDELQSHVQELTAEVSKLDANLKSSMEALQKESEEKDALWAEHDDLQQQHQKLTEDRAQLDEKVKNAEKQLIEREELHKEITEELNLVRKRRDELQGRVQELTADVSRLETELKNRTDTLQKESGEKNTLAAEHDDLQQQYQKLTKERTQLDEKVSSAEERLIEREEVHTQVTEELNSARERRDELQSRVQELTAEVSKLDANLKSSTEALQKESGQKKELEVERDDLQQQHQKLMEERTQLDEKVKNAEERLIERNELEKLFSDKFKTLSSDVLKIQGESFKSNAEESLKAREEAITKLVKPLSERIEELDRVRAGSAAALREQIATLTQANKDLTSETSKLSSALTKGPRTRGRWGEMQVERALELSGLTKGIHYTTQDSDQQGGRTDFIVHLPHERDIIIDSKVSMSAYLEAENATDDAERAAHLVDHARHIRNQVDDLAKKEYWQNLPATVDFVVMAIPDFALPPAVQQAPDLIDHALEKQVVLVTFSTLVPLLKCVAMGWQEREVERGALKIAEIGRELHNRLYTFAEHLEGIGNALERAVGKYNDSVGSFDSRVLVQARRFLELGVQTTRSLPEPETIDLSVRSLRNQALVIDETETDATVME